MALANPLKRILYRLYERPLLGGLSQHPVPRHLGLIQDGQRHYARPAGLSKPQVYRRGPTRPATCSPGAPI